MTTYVTPEPVVLDGFQAILKPGDWGYKLSALLPKSIVSKLEEERESALDWARSKAKNPKRVTVKPEPWEELENNPGTYQVRFSWKDKDKLFPAIVDSEGTLITDKETPLYNGSTVKLAFFQKPYIMPAGDIGTSLKLKAVQVISLNNGAGVTDQGNMSAEEALKTFGGPTTGFKVDEPEIVDASPCSIEEQDDDF